MIGVDTNLLVYAHRSDSVWHEKARECLATLVEGRQLWAIAWPCVHEFLAIVTNKKIFPLPTPFRVAFLQIAAWSQASGHRFIGESPDHMEVLGELCVTGHATGGQIHDARVAAICRQHGVREFWTADRDFSRFPSLKTRNPLMQ
jgi:toxin-antitoxin system PIN domain toxin